MSYMMIAGTVLGVAGGAMSAGKKVRVPEYQKVDIEGEQNKAIGQNLKSLPQSAELAAKTASADQDTLTSLLRRAIPGYDQMLQQSSSNINAQLRGEIPTDVSNAVLRSGAARALGSGLGGGSALGRNMTLRDLGLTSMGQQQTGLQNAMAFIQNQKATGMVNPMSAGSMFVSPQQRMAIRERENAAQFNRDLMAAQVRAQPDPMMAAIGGALSSAGGGMMGGGMMGGGGKGGGGGAPSMQFQFANIPQTGGYYQPGGFQYSIAPTAPPNVYAGVPQTGNYYSGGFGY